MESSCAAEMNGDEKQPTERDDKGRERERGEGEMKGSVLQERVMGGGLLLGKLMRSGMLRETVR